MTGVPPIRFKLTDLAGQVYRFNTEQCPIRLREQPTGLGQAPFKFDDTAGVGQAGVTTLGRNDEPNIIGAKVFVDGPKGDAGVRILRQWRKSHGRGWALDPGGPLEKFEVEDTGRYQMVRLFSFEAEPDYVKMHALGRVADEVKWRSDESYWRTDPVVQSFTRDQFADAAVITYGEVESWAHYRLRGPISNPVLGIGGESVALPTIPIGDYLDIETDPNWYAITNAANEDKTWIGERWYAQAPADHTGNGTAVPIAISGTNTNSTTRLTVTLPQLFWSAL